MNQSTAKATLGSMLAVVAQTADSTIGILNAANTMVSKVQLYADASYKMQVKETKVELAVHQEELIRKASMDEAESDMRIKAYCDKSEAHAAAYKSSYDRFSKLFDKD